MLGGHRKTMQLAKPRPRHHVTPFSEHQADIRAAEGINPRNQVGLDAGKPAVRLAPNIGPSARVADDEDLGICGQPILFRLNQLDLARLLRLE
jgi:hypothetical protein